MRITLLLLSLFLLSCEMHKQQSIVQQAVKETIVDLTVIETLSSAIVQNDINLVKATLDGGDFEINVVDENGELVLNKAITSNRFIIADLLLKKGANPEAKNDEDQSAWDIIVGSEYESEWQLLFEEQKLSQDFSSQLIFEALSDARPDTEAQFIDLIKGYIDLGAPLDGLNEAKYSYLMMASSGDLLEVAGLLCEFPETDPNVKVERGRGRRKQTFTALTLARSEQMKALLIGCGATE
jgi:ankyrin repeat protein